MLTLTFVSAFLEPRITDAYVMRLFDMRVTNIMLLCAHAYILALPLGQYPLGILPERWQVQNTQKFKRQSARVRKRRCYEAAPAHGER